MREPPGDDTGYQSGCDDKKGQAAERRRYPTHMNSSECQDHVEVVRPDAPPSTDFCRSVDLFDKYCDVTVDGLSRVRNNIVTISERLLCCLDGVLALVQPAAVLFHTLQPITVSRRAASNPRGPSRILRTLQLILG